MTAAVEILDAIRKRYDGQLPDTFGIVVARDIADELRVPLNAVLATYGTARWGQPLAQPWRPITPARSKSEYPEPSVDPWDTFREYISRVTLVSVDGHLWRYVDDRHHWKRTTAEAVTADVLRFMHDIGTIAELRRAGKAPDVHLRKVLSFVRAYTAELDAFDNPFSTAATRPFIATPHGIIELLPEGPGWRFHHADQNRKEDIQRLYLTTALDVPIDGDDIKGVDIEEAAPLFCRFVGDLIPAEALEGLSHRDAMHVYQETLKTVGAIVAYVLAPTKRRPYFFVTLGKQGTGKSTFIGILKTIFGAQSFVQRRMADVIGNRFATADLVGARALVDDDLEADALPPGDFLKSVSGDSVQTVERKFENAEHGVKLSIAIFLLGNHNVSLKGREGAERRAIVMQLEKKPLSDDPYLVDRIAGRHPRHDGTTHDERPAILAFALQQWARMVQNGFRIETPEWMDRAKERWLQSINSTAAFFAENVRENLPEITVRANWLHERYSKWCKAAGYRPTGRNRFYDEARRIPGARWHMLDGNEVVTLRIQYTEVNHGHA
jgi:hypothetical protein